MCFFEKPNFYKKELRLMIKPFEIQKSLIIISFSLCIRFSTPWVVIRLVLIGIRIGTGVVPCPTSIVVFLLIRSTEGGGSLIVSIDPLGIYENLVDCAIIHDEVDYRYYDLNDTPTPADPGQNSVPTHNSAVHSRLQTVQIRFHRKAEHGQECN